MLDTTTADIPTVEETYADAPSIVSEIAWIANQIAARPLGTELPREFWLRKLAALDRIAQRHDEPADRIENDHPAHRLLRQDIEHDHLTGQTASRGRYPAGHPIWDRLGPLGYLRQEYRARNHQTTHAN
jgi:crotonobetainyl-CoA:carnitine CoA-transferase CaiB-like acyl-CoA transferase